MLKYLICFSFITGFLAAQDAQTPYTIPDIPTTELTTGPAIYKSLCAQCHGAFMDGGSAKGLVKTQWLFGKEKGFLVHNVTNGIEAAGMPAFGKALSREQIEMVVDHVLDKQGTMVQQSRTWPETIVTPDYTFKVDVLVDEGIQTPWGIEFVDARRALITERPGGMKWMVDGKLDPKPIEGLPLAWEFGDGGMMDLALDPDYDKNGWIYLGFSDPLGDHLGRFTSAMTKLVRGRVKDYKWVDQEIIFQVPHEEYYNSVFRFGCRLIFDKEGHLFFTFGDRGHVEEAQDLTKPAGKIFRINKDGSIPRDNPFVGRKGVYEGIYSYGNRNAQGISIHPETGSIWATEHGPKGGDELNLITKGTNYGWPLVTYGVDYDGSVVSSFSEIAGMQGPALHWTPSIAASATDFVTSPLLPKWKNNLLVGALKFEEVRRIVIEDNKVVSEEVILKGFGRIRDVKFGPDGALYLAVNRPELIVRLTPINR
jgi:aldose sugar dehydrogenase